MRNGEISWQEFEDHFRPKLNHFHGDEQREYNGWMYETHGQDVDYIRSLVDDPKTRDHVWTITDADGVPTISSGFAHVNRIGYVVTEVSSVGFDQCCVIDQDDVDWENERNDKDEDDLDDELTDSPSP